MPSSSLMLMTIFLIFLLALFSSVAAGKNLDKEVSGINERQMNGMQDCESQCAAITAAHKQCQSPHCGCAMGYLQAQAACQLCKSRSPSDAAQVQVLLNEETDQCRSEGIHVNLRLQLPPAAAAMIQTYYEKNDQLKQEQVAFLVLQIVGGHVGFGMLFLFAIFSRTVNRDPLFFNFCMVNIFSSVVFSFLLYKGTEGHTIINPLGEVSSDMCLAQAAYANGSQVMSAASTMTLVIQLWRILRSVILGDGPKPSRSITAILMGTPYILFLAFALPSIIHISSEGTFIEQALPTKFYCMVIVGEGLHSFIQAVYGVTLGLLIITLLFDGLIIRLLYRHWRVFRHATEKVPLSLSSLLRVLVLSLYRVVVAIAYASVLYRPPTMVVKPVFGSTSYAGFGVPTCVDLLQAAIPLISFLVLVVRSESINLLMFWRKEQYKG